MKRTIVLATAVLILSSCTSYRAFQKGREYESLKDFDKAVIEYSRALEVDPENVRYKMALLGAKREAARGHFEKGKQLMSAGHYDMAALEFELTVKLDPTNQWAAIEFQKAVEASRNKQLSNRNQIDKVKERARGSKAQPPELNPASDEPIYLNFPRPTSVKDIYRTLGNSFGINIVFDQAIKDDERITIELRDVSAQQALERVMQAANHFYKVLDERTIIVVPDNPQTRRDYEDLVIQTFYLSNGDAEQVTNVVRTMIEARNVFPLKALNAITIRDTADKVRIAQKIIEANDKARAEVVVDVELLQLNEKRLRELGTDVNLSNVFTFSPLGSDGKPIAGPWRRGVVDEMTSGDWTFNVPTVAYTMIKSATDAQLLAKPQLRISEGEKALLHIGEKVPVPVSTVNPINTGNTNYTPITSYQYQDVGIKISIEPRVHHNREVTLKLIVEVSNVAGEVTVPNQASQPIIGTRTIESTIRLKDGEMNFLAGLIRKDDASSESTIPFLGDIPILGRLFTKEKRDVQNTDLVLTMTPHIIRIPDITDEDVAPMWVGTQNNLTFRGVSPRLESGRGADPFGGPPRVPETEQFPPSDATAPTAVPPATNPNPLPQGQPPADPFRRPRPVENPPTIQRNDGGYSLEVTPRIAPQPITISLKPGEERLWTVVGMDLDGLTTESLVFRYDPRAMDVANVMVGTAIAIDPKTPPVVNLDRATGIIKITSSDGKPLRFISGGDVAQLRVRGGVTGETYLIVEYPKLTNGDGGEVSAAVAGGRAKVE